MGPETITRQDPRRENSIEFARLKWHLLGWGQENLIYPRGILHGNQGSWEHLSHSYTNRLSNLCYMHTEGISRGKVLQNSEHPWNHQKQKQKS